MHLDFFTYNKPGVENLPCAYWVFSNWYATLSASRDGYSHYLILVGPEDRELISSL